MGIDKMVYCLEECKQQIVTYPAPENTHGQIRGLTARWWRCNVQAIVRAAKYLPLNCHSVNRFALSTYIAEHTKHFPSALQTGLNVAKPSGMR